MDENGYIIAFEHADNATVMRTDVVTAAGIIENFEDFSLLGDKAKSKAKITQTMAFQYLVDNYSKTKLDFLTSDQSSSGGATAEKMLRPVFPDYKLCYDLWHKVQPFTSAWKAFAKTRMRARGPFKYPKLRELAASGELSSNKFKSWWINCSETANGSAEKFKETWLGAATYWAEKFFTYGGIEIYLSYLQSFRYLRQRTK